MIIQRTSIISRDQRLNWLDHCLINRGDFRICHKTQNRCSKWVPYRDAPLRLRENANLRELFADEVVLDIDDGSFEERRNKAIDICLDLQKKGLFFGCWWTGSKGFHIHLSFGDLESYDDAKRKRVRLYFIEQYKTDRAKQSGLIAMEHKPHFKTRKPKILQVDNYSYRSNIVPREARITAKKKVKHYPRMLRNFRKTELDNDPLVLLTKKTYLPDGQNLQRWKLVKNLSILAFRAELSESELQLWVTQFLRNLPGKTVSDFLGWFRWAASKEGNYG